MNKLLITAALPVVMLGSAAIAQTSAGTGTTGTMNPSTSSPTTRPSTTPTTDPYGGTGTASPTAPGSSSGTMQDSTTQGGSMQGSGSATTGSSATGSASNTTAAVDAAITDGFPRYDKDSSGTLSEAEFKSWVGDLKAQEMAATGKPKDDAAVQSYAGSAWASADRNSDKSVSRDELRTFLGG